MIDAERLTRAWVSSLGEEASRAYYMWIEPGTSPRWPDGRRDDTHLNVRGARAVARMIAAQLQAEVPELGSRLVASDFVVAQDGSGDFFTLTEAVAAVPDFCRDTTRILVCEGVYREKVVVPATKRNVILEGVHGIGADTDRPAVSKAGFESRRGAVTVTWDDYAAKIGATGRPLGTSGSSTVYFGGDGWTVRGLTFENAAGCVGQAVAVQCLGTDLHFIGCRFLGNQDTLYLYGAGNRDGRTCAENALRRLLCRRYDRLHFRLGGGVVPQLRDSFEGRFLHHGGLDLQGTARGFRFPQLPPDRCRRGHAVLAGPPVARLCADCFRRLPPGTAHRARRVARLVQTPRAPDRVLR